MQIIAQTAPRGKVVPRNAASLSQALSQGATTMYLDADCFSDDDLVIVGEEDILITSHGTACTVVRGQNGTQDTGHAAGANVRLAAGTELLSHSFDGSTWLSAIRCGAEAEAAFAVKIGDTVKYVALSSPHQLELLFPMTRYQPAQDIVIAVLAWSWQGEAVFWAEMQS